MLVLLRFSSKMTSIPKTRWELDSARFWLSYIRVIETPSSQSFLANPIDMIKKKLGILSNSIERVAMSSCSVAVSSSECKKQCLCLHLVLILW